MTSRARTSLVWLVPLLTAGAAASTGAGCGDAAMCGDLCGDDVVDNGFESDDPDARTQATQGGASDAGAAGAAPAPESADDKSGDANRAVEEADILQLDGTRLYAVSRYGGLAIVDVSDPANLRLLGRKRTDGMPFEMYVRNGRAYVMMNEHGKWVRSPGGSYGGRWEQTSEIAAFDISNPADIRELAEVDVPGSISDSRLVGDALYLVTHESGYCYGCQQQPGTIVTSFNIGSGSITKVDHLDYRASSQSYLGWRRSVSATNQRMYVAGPEWTWQSGTPQTSSVIQVVDISNPTGLLAKGADVVVAGQIQSRWQMDEHAGVLRVVSQFGGQWGGGTTNPKVQTFTVTSASQVTPLGQTELVLPKPESLRSVRFDGTRGYAITSERTDPLFTIDLSNPALPRQAGELEMPGFIFHMEPRGDRLIGFGYDDTNMSNAKLAVSLFDVSNLEAPTMLKRVSFGPLSSRVTEDQDRIHKSVRVLDSEGLVLVPFAGSGRFWGGVCEKPQSGIQLIDLSRDDLVLRGVAPQYGVPRRAFVSAGKLFGVSDRSVSSFDIAARDTPAKLGEIDLSNPAHRLLELPNHYATLTNDWWSGEAVLAVTAKEGADEAAVSGKLSLAGLATPDESTCTGRGWTSWYDARLFTSGSYVYVTVPVFSYDGSRRTGKLLVGVVDVSDPRAPRLVGKTETSFNDRDLDGYYAQGCGFWEGRGIHGYYGSDSLLGSGQGIVQLGTKLAYLEVDLEPIATEGKNGSRTYRTKTHRRLHVIDLSSPTAPAASAPLELGASNGATPLQLLGSTVLTSRWVPVPQKPGRVRFFVDRVDIGGASPVRLSSLNTPGSLLLADQATNRLVTTDYAARRADAADWSDCQSKLGWNAYFDYDSKACVALSRTFKLVDVDGTRVTLRNELVPPAQNIAGVLLAEDRVYVTRHPRYDYTQVPTTDGTYSEPRMIDAGGLWALGGVRDGKLAIVSQLGGQADWPLAARGTKVALYTPSGIMIVDTQTATPTVVAEANLRGHGYSSHVLLSDDRAVCSLGEFGIQTVRY